MWVTFRHGGNAYIEEKQNGFNVSLVSITLTHVVGDTRQASGIGDHSQVILGPF